MGVQNGGTMFVQTIVTGRCCEGQNVSNKWGIFSDVSMVWPVDLARFFSFLWAIIALKYCHVGLQPRPKVVSGLFTSTGSRISSLFCLILSLAHIITSWGTCRSSTRLWKVWALRKLHPPTCNRQGQTQKDIWWLSLSMNRFRALLSRLVVGCPHRPSRLWTCFPIWTWHLI